MLKFKVLRMQCVKVREIVLKLETSIISLYLNDRILILCNNFNQNIAILKKVNLIIKAKEKITIERIKYLYNEFERFIINIP